MVKSLAFSKQSALIDLSIDVSDLSKGLYFLELRFPDGKTGIKRFIKQ